MKRIFCGLLCAAALLLTACGQKTAAQAEAAADPAVAAAQQYQSMVQAVGDGASAGVDLTDAQIAQAVAQLSDAGLTAVHVDAADPVTHPERGRRPRPRSTRSAATAGCCATRCGSRTVRTPSRARASPGATGRFPSATPIRMPSRP